MEKTLKLLELNLTHHKESRGFQLEIWGNLSLCQARRLKRNLDGFTNHIAIQWTPPSSCHLAQILRQRTTLNSTTLVHFQSWIALPGLYKEKKTRKSIHNSLRSIWRSKKTLSPGEACINLWSYLVWAKSSGKLSVEMVSFCESMSLQIGQESRRLTLSWISYAECLVIGDLSDVREKLPMSPRLGILWC